MSIRCAGSSLDPRAVKVTSTENGTQPEKLDLKSEFSGCILSLMNTGARPARGRYRGAARRAGHARPGELRARGARDKWQPARARHPRQVATQWGRRVRATSEMLPLVRRFGSESAPRPACELVFVLRSQHTCHARLTKKPTLRTQLFLLDCNTDE